MNGTLRQRMAGAITFRYSEQRRPLRREGNSLVKSNGKSVPGREQHVQMPCGSKDCVMTKGRYSEGGECGMATLLA